MVIVMSGHINGVAVRWGSTVYMYFVSNDLLDSDLPVGYPPFDLQYSRMLWFDLYRGREGGREGVLFQKTCFAGMCGRIMVLVLLHVI